MLVIDAHRIRIALALVALKHKPKDISYAGGIFPFTRSTCLLKSSTLLSAYVLDLREKYPPTKESIAISDEPWRNRALRLEEEVKELKRKYEEELFELDILRENARPDNAKKKKRKLNAADEGCGNDTTSRSLRNFELASAELANGADARGLTDALGLFNSYNKLFQLSSSRTVTSRHSAQLHLSANGVLRALAKALHVNLSPERRLKISSRFLTDFRTMICSTLSCVLSLVPSNEPKSRRKLPGYSSSKETLDSLFATLITDIVIPLIKSFSQISENSLRMAIATTTRRRTEEVSGSSNDADTILNGLLILVNAIITIISKTSNRGCQELLETILLAAVAEIECLWPSTDKLGDASLEGDSQAPETQPCMHRIPRLSRQERIQQLGRSTALWYFCDIANNAISSASKPRSETSSVASDFVRDKLDVVLSRLLVRCSSSVYASSRLEVRGQSGMTNMEKGMIVSVIENVWQSR